jgi:ankyrin repeat protein
MSLRSLDQVTIPAPCEADWDKMIGNDRVRFCEHCSLHVTDLSSLTRQEGLRLVERSHGRLCVRFIQSSDGKVITRDVPGKLHHIARRVSRIAAGAFTATLSLSSAAGQTRTATNSGVLRQTEAATTVSSAAEAQSVSGVVTDPNGARVPGASVTLVNEQTNLVFRYETGDDGAYRFSILEPGPYVLTAEADGFTPTAPLKFDLRSGSSRSANLSLEVSEITELVEIPVGMQRFAVMGGIGMREPDHPLIKAAFKNDLNAVVGLIPTAVDINLSDKNTNTSALAYAIENNNREMIKALLAAGANANSANEYGRTPLMYLGAGATVEIVRDLIAARADADARDTSGQTVLMYAADGSSLAVVKELIAAGATIDARDNDDNTVLTRAAENDDPEVIKFLIQAGLSVDRKNDDGDSALMIAARNGKIGNLKALIDAGAMITLTQEDLTEALIETAGTNDPGTVNLLLDAGAKVNAKDEEGKTALMNAAENGGPKMIKALIDAGADINAVDEDGWTAIMFANGIESVRVLLNAGADTTIKTKNGETALAMAVMNDDLEMVAFLRSRGIPD